MRAINQFLWSGIIQLDFIRNGTKSAKITYYAINLLILPDAAWRESDAD